MRQMYHLVRQRRRHPDDLDLAAQVEAHMEKMARTFAWQLRDPPSADALRVLEMIAWPWSELTTVIDHPEVAPDNNAAERSMRRPALGRKSYAGSHAVWAADLAAMMFSFAATLCQWGIDPVA